MPHLKILHAQTECHDVVLIQVNGYTERVDGELFVVEQGAGVGYQHCGGIGRAFLRVSPFVDIYPYASRYRNGISGRGNQFDVGGILEYMADQVFVRGVLGQRLGAARVPQAVRIGQIDFDHFGAVLAIDHLVGAEKQFDAFRIDRIDQIIGFVRSVFLQASAESQGRTKQNEGSFQHNMLYPFERCNFRQYPPIKKQL